jgi:hypothetical protein
MPPKTVARIRQRLPAMPWGVPIRVQFSCDDEPLFGCRLCILRFGLKTGDRTRLYATEAGALSHTRAHALVAQLLKPSAGATGYSLTASRSQALRTSVA